MLDAATYTPRLKAAYKDQIRAALKEEFGYKNDMQIPRLDKIVLNIGCGAEAVKDSKKAKSAIEDLTKIAGQQAVGTKARKSHAPFRLREGMIIGAKVTLRGDRMYEFLDRLITMRCRASATSVVSSPASTVVATSPPASRNTSSSRKSTLIKSTRPGAWTS